MPKLVSVAITANVSGFKAGSNQVATASRQMATAVQQSAGKAVASIESMSQATRRLSVAERVAADAAGKVRVAESQLAAVRAKGNATSAQTVKAEEQLYKATRKLAAAQDEVTEASKGMQGQSFFGNIEAQSANLDRVAGSLLKVGAAGAAGLGLISKAAMDWESDWAGVTKTVDGSSSEMAELQDQLRGLTKVLPATHHEIAAVAEAAGQLGIQRESVAAFTRTMIDLGETTNLTADDAATSLAQFMNVMGTSANDVDRLGATIVDLGNKGASTERDIVEMGQRIAGAGKQIGLSAGEVLGFASSLASVGINAEAGGTAISTTFLKIDAAVRSGGAKLQTLAKTAGMTAAEFQTAFRDDAAGAVTSFVEGLGKVQQAGGDTTQILKDLSINGIRESDALRRLASAGTLLADNLGTQSAAWQSNSALVEEAAKRYATAESQARIAWNQIKDSAISAGTAMLPILAQIATAVGHLAEFFADLPEPVRVAGVALLGTVTTMALLGGGAIKAITGLVSLRSAFQTAGLAATGMGRAVKIAQLSLGPLGVLLFGATTAMQLIASRTTEADISMNSFADALSTVEGNLNRLTAAQSANVRAAAIEQLRQKGAFDLAKQLGIELGTLTDSAIGNADATAYMNKTLSEYINQSSGAASATHDEVIANLNKKNAARDLANILNDLYKEQLRGIDVENENRRARAGGTDATAAAAQASKDLTDTQNNLTSAQAALVTETQKIIDQFTILRDGALGQEQATNAWKSSLLGLKDAVKENGDSLSRNSAEGIRNREVLVGSLRAMNDKAAADFKATEKAHGLKAATEQATERLEANRKKLLDNAEAAGFNRRDVAKMIDQMLLTPKELKTKIATEGMKEVKAQIKDLKQQIEGLKDQLVKIEFESNATSFARKFDIFTKGKARGGIVAKGMDHGGILPGHTPLSKGDDIMFPLAGGGIQPLRGGEGIYVTEAMDDPYERERLHDVNEAALAGRPLTPFQHGLDRGGMVARDIRVRGAGSLQAPDFDQLAERIANRLGNKFGAAIGKKLDAAKAKAEKERAASDNASKIDVSNPGGRTNWHGGTFSNLFAAHLAKAQRIAGANIPVYQGGFRPSTSYSGTSHRGDALDTSPNHGILRALRSVGIAAGDRTGLGNWMPHTHAVPLKGHGYAGGSAIWQAQDYLRRGGKSQSPNSPWGLWTGTDAASSGVKKVAENGMELVLAPGYRLFKGNEQVLNNGVTRKVADRRYADMSRVGSGVPVGAAAGAGGPGQVTFDQTFHVDGPDADTVAAKVRDRTLDACTLAGLTLGGGLTP